jgi:hypothetical protein
VARLGSEIVQSDLHGAGVKLPEREPMYDTRACEAAYRVRPMRSCGFVHTDDLRRVNRVASSGQAYEITGQEPDHSANILCHNQIRLQDVGLQG